MRYCVIKDTTTIIDGSDNPDDVMVQNAINAGFPEYEILTEVEYQARFQNTNTSGLPTLEDRVKMLEDAMDFMVMGGNP